MYISKTLKKNFKKQTNCILILKKKIFERNKEGMLNFQLFFQYFIENLIFQSVLKEKRAQTKIETNFKFQNKNILFLLIFLYSTRIY